MRWLCLFLSLTAAVAEGGLMHWLNPELARVEHELATVGRELGSQTPQIPAQQSQSLGFHSGFSRERDRERWVQVDLGHPRRLDALFLIPAVFAGSNAGGGCYGFPKTYRVEVSNEPEFQVPTLLQEMAGSDFPPDLGPVSVPVADGGYRYIRVTAMQLGEDIRHPGQWFFALGEIFAFSGGADVAARCPVSASHASETQPAWSLANLVDGASALGLPVDRSVPGTHGWRGSVASHQEEEKWVQVDLGKEWPVSEVRLIPAHPPDFPEREAFGFPSRFRIEIASGETFVNPVKVWETVGNDFPLPGDNPVVFPGDGVMGRYVRVTATRLWERSRDYVFGLGELQVFSGAVNVAQAGAVLASDASEKPIWRPQSLTDGLVSQGRLLDWKIWMEQEAQRRERRQRLKILGRERDGAVAVAERRARRLALAGAALLCSGFFGVVWRGRRREESRMEALRESVARDLHDELGSQIGSIRLLSGLALHRGGGEKAALEEVTRLAEEAAESIHAMVWWMQGHGNLEELVEGARQSAERLLSAVSWDFEVDDGCVGPPEVAGPDGSGGKEAKVAPEVQRHLLLMFRETLHNVARHAGAGNVWIRMGWDNRSIRFSVQDDGVGFDGEPSGNGLRNLRERAALLNGELQIVSARGQGTEIRVEVPRK
jgi:signal transduction histidine kinase